MTSRGLTTEPHARSVEHRRAGVVVVYAAALGQGLTVVSFPASGALFKAHGLTDAQYGTLFLPQVLFTLLASLVGARLARRIGLARTLRAACSWSAMAALLLYSSSVIAGAFVFPVLLAGTAAMGIGFGLSAAPLNTLPPRLFPNRADSSLLALHTLMGAGFSLGPVLAGTFIRQGTWSRLPLLLLGASLLLALLAPGALAAHEPTPEAVRGVGPRGAAPTRRLLFWGFVLAAVIYAFAEGTFSNWAILFLHEERGIAEASAGLALSVFWGALVVGRLLMAVLVTRVRAELLWLALPPAMGAAFVALPAVVGATGAIAAFAWAGLSCSALFPLTVTLASRRFPEHAAQVSSAMIASLMFGVGLASFSIGPLRSALSLAQIYRASIGYPVALFALGTVLFHRRRNALVR
ncbi:MAG TPA: MFS transporter [Polyangiaceae bacterium]|nr:MFS transporter [Polyangiaceae bacterium]